MSTADEFRTAVETVDHDAITALFADDVRFYSPVKFRPFEGKAVTAAVFRVLLRTFEGFRYVGQLAGTGEEGDGGPVTESHMLHFRTKVNGKAVEGMDLIQLDDAGKISTFTVMIRPLSAVTTVSEAIYAGLVADGVVNDKQ
ncbi:nuclear transport factor 2 family protein [Antrihabitans cavernicola]|uniref:Nuclear transport factor 2 family protein n=1 Tax=Antrihabitans cavernicola TaxID=2495913 RepID=A0A5A7SA44_9NOCA|nr:nuclear transport factor 2 family protein [Spelaeibacter cavernicola]KAA0021707.1 nuclear transport factor 2 family protein [Spelaeibacter cavernicola]